MVALLSELECYRTRSFQHNVKNVYGLTDAAWIGTTVNCGQLFDRTTDLKWFCFEMFNIAAFQENLKVNGGELKTTVGNDIFRIVVMAKNI